MKFRKLWILAAVLVIASLLISACGSGETPTEDVDEILYTRE